VLAHAASPDSGAAAPDAPADRTAATDAGQGAGDAVAVLRELLAEERRKSDSLLEASLIWQGRAMQLEERLQALEAGPIAGDMVTTVTSPQERPPDPQRNVAGVRAAETSQGAQEPAWRRLWRRVTGGS
jgi:hypothetical protein